MDLSTSLHIRQLGYTVRYSTLLDSSFQETAEDMLLKSDFASKFCDFKHPTKSVFILSTSSDGRFIASGHGDHNIYISQVATGKVVHCLSGHRRTPWTVSFHPVRNDLLASGCLAGEVRVWDLKSGCSEVLQTEDNTAIASVAFHPFDRCLAVATADKVLLWDWNQSYPYAICQTASVRERLRYVKFDPTGFVLYTGITNPREMQEPTRCIATPPEVMPLRFREMLTSRNELLQMRAELSRSHQRMLQRYNELQARYNDLRQRYPDLAEAAQRWDSNLNPSGMDVDPFMDVSPRVSPDRISFDNRDYVTIGESSTVGLSSATVPRSSPFVSETVAETSSARRNRLPFSAYRDHQDIEPVTEPLSYMRRRIENVPISLNESASSSSSSLRNANFNIFSHSVASNVFLERPHILDALPSQANVPIVEPERFATEEVEIRRSERIPLSPSSAEENPPQQNGGPSTPENETSSDVARPPLSPIALEGLQDAVAYAREITTQSMEQFVRRHHDSIARLQQSYRHISEQAQLLMQQFSQTLDEMKKLQEFVDKKYPQTESKSSSSQASSSGACCSAMGSGQRSTGYALLDALSRMREVLELPTRAEMQGIAGFDRFTEQQRQRLQMENEISRLMKVQELIRDFDSTLPMNPTTKVYLNHHRIVLQDIRRDVTNATDSQTLTFIRVRLTEEIKEFQSFVRAWKQDIMSKIQDRSVLKSDAQAQSVPKIDAHAQTSPITVDPTDEDQAGPSTSSAFCNSTTSKTTTVKRSNQTDCGTSTTTNDGGLASNVGEIAKDSDGNSACEAPNTKRRKICEPVHYVRNYNSPAASVLSVLSAVSAAATESSNICDRTPEISGNTNIQGGDRVVSIGSASTTNIEPSNETSAPPFVSREDPPMAISRSRVTISSAVEMAMRRRQRLFASRSNIMDSSASILPDNAVRRVRQAAERLNDLERRADVLNEEVSRLSRRVSNEHPLMTQMELLERREARLRSLHTSQVRALRDLSADNVRRLRSPSPSESLSVRRDITALRRLIDDTSHRLVSRPELNENPFSSFAAFTPREQRTTNAIGGAAVPNVPWHRRPAPAEYSIVSGNPNVWSMGRPTLPDVNGETPQARRAYVILERTVNAPAAQIAWDEMEAEDRLSSFDLHRSVNRAIAGAFIGTGDVAVANNILDTTCRIQYWNVKRNHPPNISHGSANVILGRCKLNNDGSVSISDDGRLLAAFVENDREDKSLWAHTILKVVSLRPEDRGVVLYQKTFAPNAISVSISPAMGHILIGLASRRYLRLRHSPQTFAQVYRMCDGKDNTSTDKPRELKLTMNVEHRSNETPIEDMFTVRNESLNCATWLKTPGHGICYGTNKGQVLILSGKENVVDRRDGEKEKVTEEIEHQTSPTGTMRVLFRRNGRLNLLENRTDETNQYRTVVV